MRCHDMKPLYSSLIPACIAALITGCGGDSSGGTDHLQGQLMPNGIQGLSYQTASKTDTTGSGGSYHYYPGEVLQFSVGDLVLASDVPADDIITPLEFFPALRAKLSNAPINDEGLLDHRITEQSLIKDPTLLNFTRFLLALNWQESVKEGEGLDIRERVVKQLNAALPLLEEPIDFTVSPTAFDATGDNASPANILLSRICFYPEDDFRCSEPPTQAEIDAAPPRPVAGDGEDIDDLLDPDIDYKEDLISLRDRIENAKRNLTQFSEQDAETYLTNELDAATRVHANRYYLDRATAAHPASDTGIQEVWLRKIGGEPELAAMEAISTREADVTIHAYSAQTASVEYFVSGASGGESDLLVNFRPVGEYRWLKKQLRVVIK